MFSKVQPRKPFVGVSSLAEHIPVQWSYSVEFSVFFSSLVEHIELMFVGVVELIQTYFS